MSIWTRSRVAPGLLPWVFAFLLAAAFSTLIPPLQSPDENSHLTRAYLISQGDLLLQAFPADFNQVTENQELATYFERARQHNGRMGGLVDQGLLAFTDANLALAGKTEKRLSETEKDHLARLHWSDAKKYYLLPGTGYYFPAVYAPQTLGLAIGQLFNLSIKNSYQLARGITLLASFAMLWLACKFTTPNPLVWAMLMLPMTLFQLLSPTLDGLTTSLSVLTISLFLKASDSSQKHSPALSWGLAVCIFLLATSRTHLLPLLALPFYLAWRRQTRRDFYLGCWVVAGAIAWTLFALQSTSDPRVVRDHTSTELLLHYASDPIAFFKVVLASLADHELFTFYQQSFIGILGWLDTPLPRYFYPALWTGLGLCGLASVSGSTLRRDWSARLLLAGVALACIGLTFLALLVTWTPHPASMVQGVQGRYFVVPMILFGYVASGFARVQSPLRRWVAALATGGFALLSVAALTMTVLSRYH
jgi:uncharacterized membrane protein